MNTTDASLPLLWARDLDAPIAWRGSEPISRRQYLADVHAMSALLPASGPMLNITADRYRFAVGLGAAMLRGHTNLLPPNHTPDIVARLHSLFPSTYCVADDTARQWRLPTIVVPQIHADVRGETEVPRVDGSALTAQVLTSGSTGDPMPHAKQWALLVRNIEAGSKRLARHMDRPDLTGVTLVATVPAQHMYGFESTVLIALLGGAAFETERPFYPADIARALERAPRPRMLVTTPFHLKTLLDSGVALPAIDLTVCATAPLSPQVAARAEAALAAPLMEIYGCTEAGQVATRRTTAGAEWLTYDGLVLQGDGEHSVISGGHVPQPTELADVLEVIDAQRFRLLGRSNDLINIAGKRSSLSHLNYHLNMIPGVQDGAFWLPPEDANGAVTRLIAFVVAPEKTARAVQDDILAALRLRVDAAFLPRRVVGVDALPREASTGKLPAGPFAAWAARTLAHHGAER
jgi:acyl-coenzyme A synthetase/AMP-(fatty) acid ligase